VKNPATPKGILVTVAFLALYCVFAIWFGWTHHVWLIVAVGCLAGVACVGAANMLRWSRFLVYALSAGLATTWLYSIYAAARVGYFGPLSWQSITLSLIVVCFCSQTAHRHLGNPPVIAAPAPES
jgi:hypothetical protein